MVIHTICIYGAGSPGCRYYSYIYRYTLYPLDLKDTCEPKVYVSDRRMAKAIQMLQVNAF